jgi:hypothetical protein
MLLFALCAVATTEGLLLLLLVTTSPHSTATVNSIMPAAHSLTHSAATIAGEWNGKWIE